MCCILYSTGYEATGTAHFDGFAKKLNGRANVS